MAAASASTPERSTTAGGTDRPHSSPKLHRRRRLINHLHIQVPVPTSSGWSGRPSGPASAPCGSDAHASAHAHHHRLQDRPASPSLLRSPTAWIRSKGHGFGSSKHHTPRRSGNFHYDARSYAQNFDEGGRDGEEDALKKHWYLSPGLLASPRLAPPSNQGTSGGNCTGTGKEPAREPLRTME